jgi:hypothetical protein
MSNSPINLSSGLVPAQPLAQPPIDLSSGMTPIGTPTQQPSTQTSPADQLSKDEMVMTRGMANQTPTDPQEKAEFESGKAAGTVAGGSQIAADVVGLGVAPVISAVASKMPGATLSKAGQGFNELRDTIGSHTVHMTDELKDSLDAIKEEVDAGISMPQVVNKFMNRIADTDQGPLTYKEARAFYKNVGDLAQSERVALNKNAGRLVNSFRSSLGSAIQETADAAGKLEQYQSSMKGWAQGMKTTERIDAAKDVLKKYAGLAARGTAMGAGYELYNELKGILGE